MKTLLLLGIITSLAAQLTAASLDVGPAMAMLQRITGSAVSSKFQLRITPDQDGEGDWFELAPGSQAGYVSVTGNTMSSLTRGIGAYLQQYLNSSFTWQRTGGFVIPTTTTLPSPTPERTTRLGRYTYYQNVVQSSVR